MKVSVDSDYMGQMRGNASSDVYLRSIPLGEQT